MVLTKEAHQPDRGRGVARLGAHQKVVADLHVLAFPEMYGIRCDDVIFRLARQKRQHGDVLAFEHDRPALVLFQMRFARGEIKQARIAFDGSGNIGFYLLARFGELQLVGETHQKLAPKLLFELVHGAAHPLRGNEVQLRGARDRLRLGNVHEIVQVIDVHTRPPR